MATKVLTDEFSEPLDGAASARFELDAGDGNLTIVPLTGSAQELAGGMLQYTEKQGAPVRSRSTSGGRTTLTVKGGNGAQPWLRLPWAACNAATEWHLRLNAAVPSEITAHSNGGNVKLNLVGAAVTRVAADTGGGNVEVALPAGAANLEVAAKTGAGNVTVVLGSGLSGSSAVEAGSGAGNVTVHIPGNVAARIHAASGLGKVIVNPRFSQTGKDTYQSADYDNATDKVEVTAHSGAGNVSVGAE